MVFEVQLALVSASMLQDQHEASLRESASSTAGSLTLPAVICEVSYHVKYEIKWKDSCRCTGKLPSQSHVWICYQIAIVSGLFRFGAVLLRSVST